MSEQVTSVPSTISVQPSARPQFLWRIVDVIVAGIFIYAGVLKMVDPVQFANDIDNYKILPWPVSVALAFYLPWLEIFCGLALIVRYFYRGESSRTRHHVWLFWSRQPTLEFPRSSDDESRNYRCAGGALGLESFDQVFAGQALRLGLLIRQPRKLSGLLFNSTRTVRFICEYSTEMIRKLKSGKYRLYSRKKNPKTGRRRNLGTFTTKSQAKKHEQAIQYFKRR